LKKNTKLKKTRHELLDELYEIGSSKIEKEFSLERVLT
jgi:hypothetical protein